MISGRRAFIALSVGFVLAGCAADPVPADVAAGTWGGRNVEVTVDGQGATFLFKCGAVGRAEGPLALDSSGHFAVDGTYDPKLVQGGPRAARYTGNLSGTRLTVNVVVDQTTLGPFELQQGQAGAFDPCNFSSQLSL